MMGDHCNSQSDNSSNPSHEGNSNQNLSEPQPGTSSTNPFRKQNNLPDKEEILAKIAKLRAAIDEATKVSNIIRTNTDGRSSNELNEINARQLKFMLADLRNTEKALVDLLVEQSKSPGTETTEDNVTSPDSAVDVAEPQNDPASDSQVSQSSVIQRTQYRSHSEDVPERVNNTMMERDPMALNNTFGITYHGHGRGLSPSAFVSSTNARPTQSNSNLRAAQDFRVEKDVNVQNERGNSPALNLQPRRTYSNESAASNSVGIADQNLSRRGSDLCLLRNRFEQSGDLNSTTAEQQDNISLPYFFSGNEDPPSRFPHGQKPHPFLHVSPWTSSGSDEEEDNNFVKSQKRFMNQNSSSEDEAIPLLAGGTSKFTLDQGTLKMMEALRKEPEPDAYLELQRRQVLGDHNGLPLFGATGGLNVSNNTQGASRTNVRDNSTRNERNGRDSYHEYRLPSDYRSEDEHEVLNNGMVNSRGHAARFGGNQNLRNDGHGFRTENLDVSSRAGTSKRSNTSHYGNLNRNDGTRANNLHDANSFRRESRLGGMAYPAVACKSDFGRFNDLQRGGFMHDGRSNIQTPRTQCCSHDKNLRRVTGEIMSEVNKKACEMSDLKMNLYSMALRLETVEKRTDNLSRQAKEREKEFLNFVRFSRNASAPSEQPNRHSHLSRHSNLSSEDNANGSRYNVYENLDNLRQAAGRSEGRNSNANSEKNFQRRNTNKPTDVNDFRSESLNIQMNIPGSEPPSSGLIFSSDCDQSPRVSERGVHNFRGRGRGRPILSSRPNPFTYEENRPTVPERSTHQSNSQPLNNLTLNNQVAPGNRANNYYDNFKSYSRQNMLSNPKVNGIPSVPNGLAQIEARLEELNNAQPTHNNINRADLVLNRNSEIRNSKFVENLASSKKSNQNFQDGNLLPCRSNSTNSIQGQEEVTVTSGCPVPGTSRAFRLNSTPGASDLIEVNKELHNEIDKFFQLNSENPCFIMDVFKQLSLLDNDNARQRALEALQGIVTDDGNTELQEAVRDHLSAEENMKPGSSKSKTVEQFNDIEFVSDDDITYGEDERVPSEPDDNSNHQSDVEQAIAIDQPLPMEGGGSERPEASTNHEVIQVQPLVTHDLNHVAPANEHGQPVQDLDHLGRDQVMARGLTHRRVIGGRMRGHAGPAPLVVVQNDQYDSDEDPFEFESFP